MSAVAHGGCVCSRPKAMKDIAFQEEVVHTLENSIRTGNVRGPLLPPHGGMSDRAIRVRPVWWLFGVLRCGSSPICCSMAHQGLERPPPSQLSAASSSVSPCCVNVSKSSMLVMNVASVSCGPR